MASAIGGADRISLRPFDGRADAFSYRLARNVQKLLIHESYFDKNLNPMKGAYLFEELTKEMALKAWELFKDIESRGGWLHFAKEGYIQKMVHRSAEAYAEGFNSKEKPWLGVNLYPNANEAKWKEMKVNFDGRSLPIIESVLS
jgi:methylmalonyl-CoA mutase